MGLLGLSCANLACAQTKTDAPKGIIYEENVEYGIGGEQKLHLDIARPAQGDGPFPGIIAIHGGGWRGGNRSVNRPWIQDCARQGYVAITVEYRFAPKDIFPAQVEDVKCAVRWMRAHAEEFKLDKDHIGAIGMSAGGHLSLMLGVLGDQQGWEGTGGNPKESSKVQAVVNYFGPTDMTQPYPPVVQGILKDFLGGTLDEKKADYIRSSPISHLNAGDAPILTFHGTVDGIVPFDQAKILDAACKQANVPHRLETMEGANHGWGGADLIRTLTQSREFFDLHLKPKTVEKQ